MAEAAAGAVVEEVVKCAVPPIKRGFNYLCCFTSNINNLEKEAEDLEAAEKGIEMKVETALNAGRVKDPTVENWLPKAKEIKDEKTAILDQVPNVGSVCLNLRARFSLSKRATKTAESMKMLRDEGNFDVISLPGPPPAREAIPLGNTYEFESRKQIEEDIMAVLRSGDVRMIGICGMGGLGKTTMAKKIMNRVMQEHVFVEAVFAVVSQNVDKCKIQLEIGGSLGLKLEEKEPEAVKKHQLHARLSNTNKTLLVLDDVWKPINLLEEFGIPCDSKDCTILITSRNKITLSKMDVKDFGMESLSDKDARIFFRKKAGTCMDDVKVKSIAEEIVNKCGGLPIALETVGAALKDKKDPGVWSNALRELSRRVPDHIEGYIANVYNPLILSYEFLSSKQDKSIFLLCCLFPEDANIDVEQLTCFGMGLGIFEGIRDLEDARGSVSASIATLRGRSLLLDGEESDHHVRMHDVIRDVCILIAKQEGHVGGINCSWISSFEQLRERTKLPTGLQNLNLLFLSRDRYYKSEGEEEFKFDRAFLEGTGDLNVLCIQSTSLPITHSLKNLKSLILDSCYGLETLFVVGELENLEILICRRCYSIKELPLEIKRSNHLKLLELTECYSLQKIGQGILSSLSELEELKMLKSFNKWGPKDGKERENAGLRELEALKNLRCLEIEILEPALAVEKIHLSSKIKRFRIRIGTSHGGSLVFNDHSYNKRMVLESKKEEPGLGNGIKMQLIRDAEYLYLRGNVANSVDLAKCQNVRWLELEKCGTMKNIITTSMVDDATAVPASLEHLILTILPDLEMICDGPISADSFHNLKELKLLTLKALKQLWESSSQNIYVPPLFTNLTSIRIDNCPLLCNLEQLSIDCLPQLQELVIRRCKMMEQVFLWNKEEEISEPQDDHCITKVFPKLKEVNLCYSPDLATFYQGMGGIKFPLLTKLSIVECSKLRTMGRSHNTGGSNVDTVDDFSHLFCQPKKVSFAKLKELSLEKQWNPFCGHKIPLSLLNGLEVLTFSELYGSTSLFSSSVAENLVNLRQLKITNCNILRVIEDNKEEEEKVVTGTAEMANLFPKLEVLYLETLSKLVTFCEWKCDFTLPSLRGVTILWCHAMENLSLGFLAAPNVEAFTLGVKNNLEIGANVSFDSLKRLEISESEKPFYGHNLFNGLKELEIFSCEGSMSYLFTSSIARRLSNLEVLTIEECKVIVKVIEDDENVGSGGERTLLFPKLKRLELIYLPELVSFCELKCDIKLPSLRNVVIKLCPSLRTFTMGSIAAAPNLEIVKIEDEDIDGTKDLNSLLQQQYMAREEM